MINEMTAVLPLLMSDDADALLKDEIINNNLLKINTETTRRRAVAEFVRRNTQNIPHLFRFPNQRGAEELAFRLTNCLKG